MISKQPMNTPHMKKTGAEDVVRFVGAGWHMEGLVLEHFGTPVLEMMVS